ncbi:DNA-3-methyladenine glycosylase I, partial [Inquilinus sp.]|uniref:DNA-3-methyladenine glycosylase I n=1 Tax=Inquilinus sp. TaxID=1932117 RepID=UPI0037840B9A
MAGDRRPHHRERVLLPGLGGIMDEGAAVNDPAPLKGYCAVADRDPLHKAYHDTEYGFPARDDAVLFERLILEINQAGLS